MRVCRSSFTRVCGLALAVSLWGCAGSEDSGMRPGPGSALTGQAGEGASGPSCEADEACGMGRTCSEGSCACDPDVSFTRDVLPILEAECAGCHGENALAGLDLRAGHAFAALVDTPATQCEDGRALVEPGHVDGSYLLHKLTNTELCMGNPMPPPSRSMPEVPRMLADAQVDIIAAWICQGAAQD